MSSGGADVVRAFMDATADRDYDSVRDCLAPDLLWLGTRGGMDEDQVVRGPDAAIRYIREIDETWRRFDVEVEQTVELGDVVLAYFRERALARHADLEVENATAAVFVIRGGKISEVTGYLDRDEALAAARGRASG